MRAKFRISVGIVACTCMGFTLASSAVNRQSVLTGTSEKASEIATYADVSENMPLEESATEIPLSERWHQSSRAKISLIIIFLIGIGIILVFHLQYRKNTRNILKRAVSIETARLKKANEILEQQKKEIQSKNEQLEAQNQMISDLSTLKTRYFANISHEFRTLITLIKSPIEKLLNESRIPKKNLKDLEMIRRNAGRLIELVNQLLDLSRLDRGKMSIHLIRANVFDFAHTLAVSFTSLAEVKGICFKYDIPSTGQEDWIDHDKIEKMINNLLSNAFKFTDEGGKVHLRAERKAEKNGSPAYLEVIVSDTGPGIPVKEQKKIFDPFYQAEHSLSKGYGGTGLGLALSYELAKLLKGDLEVKSEPGKGSTFILNIPLGKEHLQPHEYSMAIGSTANSENGDRNGAHILSLFDSAQEAENQNEERKAHPMILLVEDHNEIRGMIADFLFNEFKVLEAVDGSAGLRLAREHLPDLVVTDLVMPRLDGMELCYKLKTDMLTSHIPVIILTARSSTEFKLKGYETGADDYIIKPFNVEELAVRIRSLIDQRRSLREKFSAQIAVEPSEIMITSLDKKFLDKAIQVVEKHMSDDSFSVAGLSKELNMSRSTLFRKLEAITNQSPVEFIRAIRLKRAASLLMQRYGNISEVALQVGFKNPSYFTQMFRKAYSKTPKEYAKS